MTSLTTQTLQLSKIPPALLFIFHLFTIIWFFYENSKPIPLTSIPYTKKFRLKYKRIAFGGSGAQSHSINVLDTLSRSLQTPLNQHSYPRPPSGSLQNTQIRVFTHIGVSSSHRGGSLDKMSDDYLLKFILILFNPSSC